MPATDHSSELDLRDYLRVLWRRRAVIGLVVLAAVVASLGASFVQSPTYEASAELVLQDQSNDAFTQNTTVQIDQDRVVQNEIQVLTSKPVADRVRQLIGAAPSIQTDPITQTNAIRVTARARRRAEAADTANAYASAYIDVKRTDAVGQLRSAENQIRGKVGDLQRQIDTLNATIAGASPADRPAAVANLGPQRNALVDQQAVYRKKLDELEVDARLETGGAQLATPAAVPGSPASPKPVRNAILALAVGLILGLGAALLFEYLDDSIKSKEDLDQALGGLPTLGLIPAVNTWKSRGKPFVVSLAEPLSPAAESYRSLRTSVQFLSVGRSTTVVEVTSPNAGEGKTTTIVNLAVGLAQAGERVCVVCCDLRRPRVHAFFGLTNEVGFTSVVTGEASLSGATKAVADVEGLSLLASGPLPPNPSELLSSERAAEVLTALRARFDCVLVDSPPVLPVTDAAVLASQVDVTLMVANAGSTSRRAVVRAVDLLTQVEAPLVGGVLNGITADLDDYGYGYGYASGYYRSEAQANASGNRPLVSPSPGP